MKKMREKRVSLYIESHNGPAYGINVSHSVNEKKHHFSAHIFKFFTMNIIVFVCYKMFKKFLCIMKNQFFLTIDLMDK
jgi:hypothetical protein